MVGFDANDTLTSTQKIAAAAVAGITTRFLTQPLDIIKTRTQLQKKPIKTHYAWFNYTRRIYKEEGLLAFWHGHRLGQIQSILGTSTEFYVYDLTTRFLEKSSLSLKQKSWMTILCGIFAGCCMTVVVIPLEVIKTRQMISQKQYGGLIKGAKAVFRSGGLSAFYGGLSASLLQIGPQSGVSFAVFTTVQPFVLNKIRTCDENDNSCNHATLKDLNAKQIVIASSIAGASAGFVSKTLLYPLELSKKRLQLRSHKDESSTGEFTKCSNLFKCMQDAFTTEGFRGLYRGWRVAIYKSQISAMLIFTSYEMYCHSLRT